MMSKVVKKILGACIVLVVAGGAFFTGSTYYEAKQKDAQLSSIKKESSVNESKYVSSKQKAKADSKNEKESISSESDSSSTTSVISSEVSSESSAESAQPAQKMDEQTARSLIARAVYSSDELTLLPTDDGKYHFQNDDTDTFMVVEPDNFNAWTEAYVDEQDSDGDIITTNHFTND